MPATLENLAVATRLEKVSVHSTYTHICVLYVYTHTTLNNRHIYYVCLYTTRKHVYMCMFSSVQSLSHVPLFATPWTAARQASLSFTISRGFFKLMSIASVMPSNHHHLILCRPLLLSPSIFHRIRVFSNESTLHIRWPKYWRFSFTISPSNEYSGLISFRMDWFDLLAVEGTPKSLLQHTVQKHQFFSAQASLWSNSHIHT